MVGHLKEWIIELGGLFPQLVIVSFDAMYYREDITLGHLTE